MEFIRQPDNRTCGPACVAMVSGRSFAEALAAVGDCRNGSHNYQIVNALISLGVKCDAKFRTVARGYPEICIVRVKWPNGRHHLVVKNGNEWLDPSHHERGHWCCLDGRIVSALWVH